MVRALPALVLAWPVGGWALVDGLRSRVVPTVASVRDPVDLNSADACELAMLPRIGPALAAAIVDDRRDRGPFRSLAEVDRVKGIGPATLSAIAPHVVARPAYAPR